MLIKANKKGLVTEIGGWVDRFDRHGRLLFTTRTPTTYPSDAQLLPDGNVLDRKVEYGSEFLGEIDWACTRAYFAQDKGVWVNLAGREAEGIVRWRLWHPPAKQFGFEHAVFAGIRSCFLLRPIANFHERINADRHRVLAGLC